MTGLQSRLWRKEEEEPRRVCCVQWSHWQSQSFGLRTTPAAWSQERGRALIWREFHRILHCVRASSWCFVGFSCILIFEPWDLWDPKGCVTSRARGSYIISISKLCKNFLTFRLVQVNKWKNEKVGIETCDKWLFLDEFCCFFQVLYFWKNAWKSTFGKKTGYFGTYGAFWPFSLAQAQTSPKKVCAGLLM